MHKINIICESERSFTKRVLFFLYKKVLRRAGVQRYGVWYLCVKKTNRPVRYYLILKKYNKVIIFLQGSKTSCQQKILGYRTYLFFLFVKQGKSIAISLATLARLRHLFAQFRNSSFQSSDSRNWTNKCSDSLFKISKIILFFDKKNY